MNQPSPISCTAFCGTQLIASGHLRLVAFKAQTRAILSNSPILIFDDITGNIIDIDLRAMPEDPSRQIAEVETGARPEIEPTPPDLGARGPGRPRLGVVAREVTLLPRHWDWLATQPGGASVALRKLVEQAKRANQGQDRRRLGQEATYRFMSAMAGDEPGFEEATRALFAGDQERFTKLVEPWPVDVGGHAKRLAGRAFEPLVVEQMSETRPRYTLDELLAKCDSSRPLPPEDKEWIDAPAVGHELP